jgi:hypothetical protein
MNRPTLKEENQMTTSIRSKSIIAIFAVAAIAPVASASASVNEPVLAGYYSASSATSDTPSSTSSVTALSHDSNATVALRRDGSQAAPVVANLGSEPNTASDGFDWGDAAIGAGAGLFGACLAALGVAAIGGRRSRTSRPATAASQSA